MDRILEQIFEEEVAHPAEIALRQAGPHLGRGLDDVVLFLGTEVAVGAQRAGLARQIDAIVRHLGRAVHRVEEACEGTFRKGEVHVARQVGLKDLVRTVDEVDVLDGVLPGELTELGQRQVLRFPSGHFELGKDLGQHLVHVGGDAFMLKAQHGFEDGEALGETDLEAVDLVGLLLRDQACRACGAGRISRARP